MRLPEEMAARILLRMWKAKFGPFIKCPECYGLLRGCKLCKGSGKVIQEDVDEWNNPISKFMRLKENDPGWDTKPNRGKNYDS